MQSTEQIFAADPCDAGQSLPIAGQPAVKADAEKPCQAGALSAESLPPWCSRLDVLLRETTAALAQVLKADFSVIAEVVEGDTALQLSASAAPCEPAGGNAASLKVANSPDVSMAAYALQAQAVVDSDDLGAESRFTDAFLARLGAQSAMMIPCSLDDKPFGVMGVCHKQPRPFTPSETRCAGAVGRALELLIAGLDAFGRQASETSPPGEADGAAAAKRRTSQRFPYRYRQRIAAVVDRRPPLEQDFFEVECHDLSAGGFSFFCEERPKFGRLVAEIGQGNSQTHVIAEVVRVIEVRRNGGVVYLVGCRFLKRVLLWP